MADSDYFQRLKVLLALEQAEERKRFEDEIEGLSVSDRVKKGLAWFPVVVSEARSGPGGQLIIEIDATQPDRNEASFPANAPITLFSRADGETAIKSVAGIIMKRGREAVTVLLDDEELPEWIDDGQLGLQLHVDDKADREMQAALDYVAGVEHGRLKILRDVLTGIRPPSVDTAKHWPYCDALNESQNRALMLVATAEDLAVIHGPPGTGKTTTLIECIAQLLTSSTQILVCAPSNAAVDLLALKLTERGLSVLRMGNPARVQPELWSLTLLERQQAHRNYPALEQMQEEINRVQKEMRRFRRSFGPEQRAERQALQTQLRGLRRDARLFEKQILGDVIDGAQVIACTLVGASHRLIRDRHYDCLVIDEAAQALEPACWIPICKADKLIMAGDHCQLPPTIRSQQAAKGLSITLFERCIERWPQAGVMLQEQYRMHQQIMEFSSRRFYAGQLKAHASVADRGLADAAIEWIDTAGTGFEERIGEQGHSYSNAGEIDLLLKHLEQLLPTLPNSDVPWTIGVIAPYSEQIQYLRDAATALIERVKSTVRIEISSVDAFQGQERDVVYWSLVRSNNEQDIGFLKEIRRSNVAMTRARRKLVIIGDTATLASHPFYSDLLAYVEGIDGYRSAWEY